MRLGEKTAPFVHHAKPPNVAWMVKPLSAGCVNTVVILITSDCLSQLTQRKLTCTQTKNRKLTLCGLSN